MIVPEIEKIRTSAYSMQPHSLKMHFIFLCTTLSFVWIKDNDAIVPKGHVIRLWYGSTPIFYKAPNTKAPYVWLSTNNFGMLFVVSSFEEVPFSVSLERKERRGKMHPLEVDVFPGRDSRAHVRMMVNIEREEEFAVLGVDKAKQEVPDFLLLLTSHTGQYLRSVLIQPASGTYLLYPVSVQKIK